MQKRESHPNISLDITRHFHRMFTDNQSHSNWQIAEVRRGLLWLIWVYVKHERRGELATGSVQHALLISHYNLADEW